MLLRLLLVIGFLFIPSIAYAWGPLTHVYLGNQIFYLGSLLPVWIINLLRRYRQDYLYGNLMADMMLAKNLLPLDKNTHSWEVALRLFESAERPSEKAFSLGYACHLAADTVAHGEYTFGRKNIKHTVFEIRADSLINRKYWLQAITMERDVRFRNDIFLEKSLESAIFSFNTNKRIFRGMLFLAGLNKERFGDFLDRNLVVPVTKEDIKKLHTESLERMIDVLCHGNCSSVLKKNPIGER